MITPSSRPSVRGAEILRARAGQSARHDRDQLAVEEPLEIRVGGQSVAVTMRTPGHDAELAAGFLLTEGLVRSAADILEIAPCQQGEAATLGNVVNVFLRPSVEVDFQRLTRHVFASSSCGLCGKASIESVHQQFPPIASDARLETETLIELPARLRAAQATFDLTGGLHAAGIFDLAGTLLISREDVGRHNAVDKAIGHCLRNGPFPLDAHVLLVSGRLSFEIVQKALAARIPIVAAVSAPSSLAVDFARESRLTLVGFLRGEAMNVYCGAERLLGLSIR